jgi:hypothetical protein
MSKKKSTRAARSSTSHQITRFAHPFFTTVPLAQRKVINGAARMTDRIEVHLEKIPPVKGTSTMELADVIGPAGVQEIEQEKSISFHAVGDTGHENSEAQVFVANAMSEDFDVANPGKSPAFFLHLGDVNYYDNTDKGYHAQFYVPYKTYPGKIVAIPGNHDGELFRFDGRPTGQRETLQAFQNNFCQPPDKTDITSGTIERQMVSQPGVYWRLDAPFVDIVGLYSNVAENPGYIQARSIGDAQKRWLNKTLATIKSERDAGQKKALLIAVHHPPISNGSHASSTEMLADIDDSCRTNQIFPTALLSAHAHDYQRYTRVAFDGTDVKVPFLVVGSGGRGLSPHLTRATKQRQGDFIYEKALRGYGYSRVSVTKSALKIEFFQVDEHSGKKSLFDSVSAKV